ncbi:crotonase/enoyl-CoA hydratase family protein [Simplicispira suum]|uniref:Enoyl-CoA hydratase n=1 Tax=Simplicispira suum TaxID=2109915 RepID=A0A2S0MXU2_9BURK|nr:crotonase/enoyl-CoA hydratase family protein [Simplicispira suum]AVO40710.1 enoyl-CoA hydratase [Simplicispira suum]
MTDLVSYAFADGVATLTMDDGKANAMNPAMQMALNAALDRAEADKAIVVLTGRPGVFSGGFDLSVFKAGNPQVTFQMLTGGAQLAQRLLSYPHPVVAACSGHAMAMGLFLLQCADVRIGLNAGATFQANEVLIGMTLPYFALEALRERVATPHLHLVGTGLAYSGADAVQAGLLDEAVAPESLAAAVQAQVDRLKKAHPASFTATKQRLRASVMGALPQAIESDKADWMRLGTAKA